MEVDLVRQQPLDVSVQRDMRVTDWVQAHQTECQTRKDSSEQDQTDDQGNIPPKLRGAETHVHVRIIVDVLVCGPSAAFVS